MAVRLTWFNLMPWPDLPDNFREAYRSVWVDIPNTLYDPKRGHHLYHQYMDQLEYADSLGFDGIGVNEHHQNGYGLMPSPNIIAAGLARRTSKAAICVIGNSIALYNPPIRVAEEFAMLDVISGGRLVAGFPVGTPMDTNFCYGQIPALTRDKYYEAHELIMKAWASERGVRVRRQVQPAPPRQRVAQADPEAAPADLHPRRRLGRDLRLLRRLRLQLLVSLVHRLQGGQGADGRLLGARRRQGQGRSARSRGFAQIVFVADTDREAEELYSEHANYFFNRCLHIYPGFAEPPGYRTIKTIKSGKLSQMTENFQRLFSTLTWKDLVEGGYIIAGSPATVREQMEHMIKELRLGNVFCLFHTGNMPDWKTRHSTQLFAEKVMPHLQKLWPEYDGDDRWWIKPYDERTDPAQSMPGGVNDARAHARDAERHPVPIA